MLLTHLLLLSTLVYADTPTFSKVPSGKFPIEKTKPCVETGVAGEEHCKIPAPTALPTDPKLLELPKPQPSKKTRVTPRKK